MAHNIDFQKGYAAFVSLQEKPWHELGKVVESEMTTAEVLPLAGLDFEVRKAPNIHRLPDGNEIISSNSFFTFRTDTGFVLGDKLGKQYTVMQNAEALNVLDELISTNKIIVETAGSLNNGATVFITCRRKTPLVVGKSDEVEQYIVLTAGHDGNTAIMAFFTNVRVVCANTLALALQGARQKHSIRHTRNAKDKLNEALRIMKIAEQNSEVAATAYNRLAEIQLKQADFWNYLGNVFFTPAERKDLQTGKDAATIISSRKRNTVNKVLEFAETGIGQQEARPGSAWWAYNAVTGYFSNVASFKDRENRMESLLWGSANDYMDTALDLALHPQKVEPLTRQAQSFNWN